MAFSSKRPTRRFRASERRVGAVQADIVERTGLGREETAMTPDRHMILLNLKGTAACGQSFVDGNEETFIRCKPGAVMFLPAGRNFSGWEIGAATAAYLAISLEPAFVERLFERTTSAPTPTLRAIGNERG